MASKNEQLFEALEKRDIPAIKKSLSGFLFMKGADVNAINEKGWPALCLLAQRGEVEAIRLLLDKGADLHAKYEGLTSLMLATRNGASDIVKLLLERGADPDEKGSEASTALHFASAFGHREIAKLLLSGGAEIGSRNSSGITPLYEAVWGGKTETALMLIEKGADVNVKNNSGNTPLMAAVENGHGDLCTLLISKGADVNVKDIHGMTALSMAYFKQNNKLAKILRDHLRVHEAMVHNELYAECGVSGDLKKVKALLGQGVSPDSVNDEKSSCLYHAAREGNTNITRLLLEAGADVDYSEDGLTPLIGAIKQGCLETADLLLNYGADANKGDVDLQTNRTLQTPLQAALRTLDIEMSEHLVSKGAKLTLDAIIEGLAPVSFLSSTLDLPGSRMSSYYSCFNSRVGSLSPSLYGEVVRFLMKNKADLSTLKYSSSIPDAIRKKISSSHNIINTEETSTVLVNMLRKIMDAPL